MREGNSTALGGNLDLQAK